ncbi:Protein hgh1 [Tyrophagus putrescentiae]|nr:Protein hgh1 [Tyrophagus putrescentiae]
MSSSDMSEVKKAAKVVDQSEVFADLLFSIMATDKNDAEREAYIRANASKVIPLTRWLSKLIVTYEKQQEEKQASSGKKTSVLNDGEEEEEEEEEEPLCANLPIPKTQEHELVQLSVHCLLFISAAASFDEEEEEEAAEAKNGDLMAKMAAVCASLAAVFTEPAQTELLYHLNARIVAGRALNLHLSILANLTRSPAFVQYLVEEVIVPRFPEGNNQNSSGGGSGGGLISSLIAIIRVPQTPVHSCGLGDCSSSKKTKLFNPRTLVAGYLNNLTMSATVRQLIVERKLIPDLLALYESRGRLDDQVRQLAVSALRNCAMDVATHRTLLTTTAASSGTGEDVEDADGEWLLVRLVLPLAGGYSEGGNSGHGDHFTTEEMDRLPLDLQYLPSGKQREPDPINRAHLLETLLQLCRTRYGTDGDQGEQCTLENLIDVLIKTEEELGGVDDLQVEVEVPPELADKFNRLDRQALRQAEAELMAEAMAKGLPPPPTKC